MAKKKVTPTEGEELQPTDPITPTLSLIHI